MRLGAFPLIANFELDAITDNINVNLEELNHNVSAYC